MSVVLKTFAIWPYSGCVDISFLPIVETSLRLVVASRLSILGYERVAVGRPESMHEQCSEGRSWTPDCPCASLGADYHSATGVHSTAAIDFC